MTFICPAGDTSAADDYCDVCGLPIGEQGGLDKADLSPVVDEAIGSAEGEAAPLGASPDPQTSPEAVPGAAATCPNCNTVNPPNALFCEACGYDFTTGSVPRPVSPPPVPQADPADVADAPPVAPAIDAGWVAEVWIDPDWYAAQLSDDPLPSAGLPVVVPLRSQSLLVGRASQSRGISPDIDLSSDSGISRRHCQLTTDGRRWWVEDLGSSNGTFVADAVGPLPRLPLVQGHKRELDGDDRIYLGAWTRLAIRRAEPGEG